MEPKKKLNVAGAAAFDNILHSLARTDNKEPEKQKETEASSIADDITTTDTMRKTGEDGNALNEKVQDTAKGSGKALVEKSPEVKDEENTQLSKKELEITKKFLAARKNKVKTSPIMVELPLKNIVEQISNYMGINMQSFVCNILEDNIRENKQYYLDLMNRKKPTIKL